MSPAKHILFTPLFYHNLIVFVIIFSKEEGLMKKRDILIYIMLAIACLFLVCLSTNYDYDLFARLIVGERFIENGILPFKDFLSYTPTHPWYDHEWGSGVVFYLFLKYLGSVGLILLQAVLMFFTAVFVLKTQKLQKHAYPVSLVFMGIFLALFMRLNSELIRCQLFSFMFFSMFLYFLEKARKKGSNLVWFIPLITIIWNNLHGGIVSGLGLIFLYFIGALIERKPWKKYIAVLAVSTPLLVINPYGLKYLQFLFSAATKHRKYITEWWPFYHRRHVLYYMPMSLYGIFAFVINFIENKKIDITKTLVLAVTLYSGLAHVKLLSITIIAAAALCYNDFCKVFGFMKKLTRKIEKSLYLAIPMLALLIPLFSPLVPRADLYKLPLYEIEFLKINHIKGNIVVPFGFGSYTSYKLYPDNLIFMDGRYEEVYDDKEFIVLRNFNLNEPNWDDIIKNYDTDILMPQKTADIYSALVKNKDWELIFEGRLCGIFVKKDKRAFSYYEPEYNIDYYRKTMFKHGDYLNE